VPHETVIGPGLIIRDNIENVGRLICECESTTEKETQVDDGVFFVHIKIEKYFRD
jgi:hypothetical protein